MYNNIDTLQQAGGPLLTLMERMKSRNEFDIVPEQVVVEDVVTAVLDTMNGRLSPTEAKLLREVAGLGRIIEQAKAEIASISLDTIRHSHIPTATGELGAIVEHTAIATNSILESCEMLDKLGGTLDSTQANVLQCATTQIYEACSFQDITGQRITKVVKALQAIEAKVRELSGTQTPPANSDAYIPRPVTGQQSANLLNGPSLPHEAMGQDDIDKLLGDFG